MIKNRRNRHLSPAQCGCQIAIDARDISGVADAAVLDTWPARRGSSHSATGSGSQRPIYYKSSVNGRPAVLFDGSDDYMSFSGGALDITNAASTCSMFTVGIYDGGTTDASQVMFSIANGAGTARLRIRNRASSVNSVTIEAKRQDAETSKATAGVGTVTVPHIAEGDIRWTSNAFAGVANGVASADQTFNSGAGTVDATSAANTRVGAQTSTAGRFNGRICAAAAAVPRLGDGIRRRIRAHYGFSFRIATA